MALFQKANNFLGRYRRVVPFAKFLHPIFVALFYICMLSVALIAIISFILLFINVDTDKMLLPPHMDVIRDASDNISAYSLNLGNGIKLISDAADVTLSHIKLVIYSRLSLLAVALICVCPILYFMDKVLVNIKKGDVLGEKNAAFINFAGLIIAVGSVVYNIINNVFNYAQINKFTSELNIEFCFDIQWFGVILGLFIIAIGTIYGYACSVASEKIKILTDIEETEETDITLTEEESE